MPAIILLHGGGWTGGEPEQMERFAPAILRAGWAVINAGYRLAPAHVWPAQRDDLHALLQDINQRADELGHLTVGECEVLVPPLPADYAAMINRIAAPLEVQLIFEPGRMITGNAGILAATVRYVKQGETRAFLILDAAMNDLIRPALYDAWHDVIPVREAEPDVAEQEYDLVGPVCETGDTFARGRSLPPLATGDLAVFLTAGAYGAVQASEYNSRPLVPEVLVDGSNFAVIRQRPTIDEMLARERVPDWF